ncbi:MAG: hypothetical protein H6709_23545 [Kofleriaceae bacterium]|nr:hypothetical protein [Kofleriaceae bacterium]
MHRHRARVVTVTAAGLALGACRGAASTPTRDDATRSTATAFDARIPVVATADGGSPRPVADAGPSSTRIETFDGRPGWLVLGEHSHDVAAAHALAFERRADGIDAHAIDTGLFENLRPGFVAVVYGRYDDRADARRLVAALADQGIDTYATQSGPVRAVDARLPCAEPRRALSPTLVAPAVRAVDVFQFRYARPEIDSVRFDVVDRYTATCDVSGGPTHRHGLRRRTATYPVTASTSTATRQVELPADGGREGRDRAPGMAGRVRQETGRVPRPSASAPASVLEGRLVVRDAVARIVRRRDRTDPHPLDHASRLRRSARSSERDHIALRSHGSPLQHIADCRRVSAALGPRRTPCAPHRGPLGSPDVTPAGDARGASAGEFRSGPRHHATA